MSLTFHSSKDEQCEDGGLAARRRKSVLHGETSSAHVVGAADAVPYRRPMFISSGPRLDFSRLRSVATAADLISEVDAILASSSELYTRSEMTSDAYTCRSFDSHVEKEELKNPDYDRDFLIG